MTDELKLPNGDQLPEGISAAIDKLRANPQIINMVASALGGASAPSPPQGSVDSASEEAAVKAAAAPQIDKILPLIGKLSNAQSDKSTFKHEQLLCAIKPYLSSSRCEAIDQIIRISKMSAIIGQLKP